MIKLLNIKTVSYNLQVKNKYQYYFLKTAKFDNIKIITIHTTVVTLKYYQITMNSIRMVIKDN